MRNILEREPDFLIVGEAFSETAAGLDRDLIPNDARSTVPKLVLIGVIW